MSLSVKEKIERLETDALSLSREIEQVILEERVLICMLKSHRHGSLKTFRQHHYTCTRGRNHETREGVEEKGQAMKYQAYQQGKSVTTKSKEQNHRNGVSRKTHHGRNDGYGWSKSGHIAQALIKSSLK